MAMIANFESIELMSLLYSQYLLSFYDMYIIFCHAMVVCVHVCIHLCFAGNFYARQYAYYNGMHFHCEHRWDEHNSGCIYSVSSLFSLLCFNSSFCVAHVTYFWKVSHQYICMIA